MERIENSWRGVQSLAVKLPSFLQRRVQSCWKKKRKQRVACITCTYIVHCLWSLRPYSWPGAEEGSRPRTFCYFPKLIRRRLAPSVVISVPISTREAEFPLKTSFFRIKSFENRTDAEILKTEAIKTVQFGGKKKTTNWFVDVTQHTVLSLNLKKS